MIERKLINQIPSFRTAFAGIVALGSALSTGDSVVCAQAKKSWELRPYEVRLWVAFDNSVELTSTRDQVLADLSNALYMAEPRGWIVDIAPQTGAVRYQMLNQFNSFSQDEEFAKREEFKEGVDKLILLAVGRHNGRFQITAQELDIYTRQWGARIDFTLLDLRKLVDGMFGAVVNAFMPLARIESVNDKKEVKLAVRAAELINHVEITEDGELAIMPNELSPAWIQEDDVLIPVIRRNDRYNEIEKVGSVDWTLLEIIRHHGRTIDCMSWSMRRSPLSQRTGGKTEKLALVIRPPDRPSNLRLMSRGDDPHPLEGYKVFSRIGDENDQELVGVTDWRGIVEVPPSDRGFHVLYVKSGNRYLARLPMIPGLKGEYVTEMPDDETRLYAEGIIAGLQSELMDLLTRRNLLKFQIEVALDNEDSAKAKKLFLDYQKLPNSEKFNRRLLSEEKKLDTRDDREREKITTMFSTLRGLANQFLKPGEDAELRRRVQLTPTRSKARAENDTQ